MNLESNKSINIKIINRTMFKITMVVLMTIGLGCGSDDDDSGGTPAPPGLLANFTVDKNAINEKETVLFSDLSEGEPSAWEWTFAGGTPATSKEKSPIITYNSKGLFSVTLKVSDGENSHSTTKKNFIEVN
jgi:PKD repeat protein